MERRKAPGPDEINNEIIKRMPGSFHKMLVKAFIKLWKAGVTPISWKESHIALMYKKGDPTLLKNWRPVTLTNTLYKLWTAVVARLISEYAEEAGILSDTQEGFRRQKKTIKHIL